MHERNRAEGLPAFWLYLAPGGRTMEPYVSLLAADNSDDPLRCGRWEPTWGEDPHDGLRHATVSLRQWLSAWAEGGDV
ncbi:hypothetical protein [Streptomyces sp. NPDC054783]